MKILRILCSVPFLLSAIFAHAQYRIDMLDSNSFHLGEGVVLSKISFRGLSVVDDKVIWASGSRGTFARSIDGGKTFQYTQLKGYEKSDFRDIEAFDSKYAIMMSSGTPAYILKTTDGGQTWKEVYKNTDTAYFLDAMDFWDNKRGMIIGDPIDGHFVLLQTDDGGNTWKQQDTSVAPKAVPGEAIFAASGTSLRCWGKGNIVFVSGGKAATLFYKSEDSAHWERSAIPINKGSSGEGAFSVTYPFVDAHDQRLFLVAGGNYLKDSLDENNFAVYRPKHPIWFRQKFILQTNGYRSCIEALGKQIAIACGTTGVDITRFQKDGDITVMDDWKLISNESFNVVCKAKKGNAVFLAGSKGKIGRLVR